MVGDRLPKDRAVVIDMGTGTCKVGFAGQARPTLHRGHHASAASPRNRHHLRAAGDGNLHRREAARKRRS